MTSDDKYNKLTRKFNIELYPDNPYHAKAIQMLINAELSYNCRLAGILHDCDTYGETTPEHKEGDKKKPHYHFCLETKDAKRRSTLAKKLGIDERFIEPCEKWKGSLMYLIHYNIDKYQYSVDRLIGDSELINYICETSQKSNKYLQFNSIVNYINSCDGEILFTTLYSVCYKNGWLSALMKNQNLIINAVNQHNKKL